MLVYLAALDSERERTKFEQVYLTYRQVMFYTANSILRDPQLAEGLRVSFRDEDGIVAEAVGSPGRKGQHAVHPAFDHDGGSVRPGHGERGGEPGAAME